MQYSLRSAVTPVTQYAARGAQLVISSMTGFGTSEGNVGSARVVVEVRTVNHRFFTPNIKLPSSLARWEGDVRDALRKRIVRGHVTVNVRSASDAGALRSINEERFADYVQLLGDLAKRHKLSREGLVGAILRLPGVVGGENEEAPVESPDELVAVVNAAIDELAKMRSQEGKRLVDTILERIAVVERALERIAERAPDRVVEQRDRLRKAVSELAGGVAVDPQRLAQEVAFLADRLDVSEEIDRFRSHIDAFRKTLTDATGEPVGKRLGFLLQEMLREANTTGSKANDTRLLGDVVAIKEELERIREQVENIE